MEDRRRDHLYDFSVLRELRGRRKITLEALAAATGVSFSTLTRIESNQNQPSLSTLASLAEYFGMRPSHLLDMASPTAEVLPEKLAKDGDWNRRDVALPEVQTTLFRGTAGAENQIRGEAGKSRVLWLLSGAASVDLNGRNHILKTGEALRFDGSLECVCRLTQDGEVLVTTLPKRNR